MAAKKKQEFIPREISWLSFNARVLQEAADENNPLMERLRFLGIFSNNLDEFFRVRVATLNRLISIKKSNLFVSHYNPEKILKNITTIVAQQQEEFDQIFQDILNQLAEYKIYIINEQELSETQSQFVKQYYHNELRSFLFPIMIKNITDSGSLRDRNPYLAVKMYSKHSPKHDNYALIEIPELVSRFLILPSNSDEVYIILTDDIIRHCIREIFSMFDYDTYEVYTIKFTRDAELEIDNDVSKSFIEQIAESLKQRKLGKPIRLVYDERLPQNMLKKIMKLLNMTRKDAILPGSRYHNFKDFMNFPRLGPATLYFPALVPQNHPKLLNVKSMFPVIQKEDIMLHFPYQSFQYIIDLLREASVDPKVTDIKITIYRVAKNSNVMSALINAARNGKKVTVLMELQARFDEKNNIYWTEKLQEEGVKILQSRSGIKVHAKLILITRREGKKLVNYANIGTGNFNEDTARIYADDSLLTSDPKITAEVEALFNLIEYQFKNYKFKHLVLSPFDMRNHFVQLLQAEIRNAQKGFEAWAIIKLNNLVDEKIANKVLEAAKKGVKIHLIIRGISVLSHETNINNDNIRIISIVDKFLEHSRILVFCNKGNNLYYITSADWMVRNFDHRIEVACPVYNHKIQKELRSILNIQLQDNVKARDITNDLENKYIDNDNPEPIRSQEAIYKMFSLIN